MQRTSHPGPSASRESTATPTRTGRAAIDARAAARRAARGAVLGTVLGAFALGAVAEVRADTDAPSRFDPSRFELSGFGTLGFARLDVEGAEYRTGVAQDGAGTDGSFAPDTRLGVQLDVAATSRLRLGVQLLAREGPDGGIDAGLERGFVRVALGEWAGLRVGRLALPVFEQSEYRYVGYANTLVRPPEELYAMLPFGRYDGADLIVHREFGESLVEVQLMLGRSREALADDVEIDADSARGVNVSLERGRVRLRASWLANGVRVDAPGLDPFVGALATLPPGLPGLESTRDALAGDRRRVVYTAVGVRLDLDPVTIEAEYARRGLAPDLAVVPDARGWYVSVARRFDAFTPYAFVASFDEDKVDLPLVLPPGVPALDALGAALGVILPQLDQDTAGLGLRWDAAPDLALKLQVERVRRDTFGIGFARGSGVAEDPGTDVTLVSATLDFVF